MREIVKDKLQKKEAESSQNHVQEKEVESLQDHVQEKEVDSPKEYAGKRVFRYRYADQEEAKKLYLAHHRYFQGINTYDLQYRLQKNEGSVEELKEFGAEQMMDFTAEEKDAIDQVMNEMETKIKEEGYHFPRLKEIIFVRTTMKEENGGGAYTHGTEIYFGRIIDRLLSENKREVDSIRHIIWHEIFHCLTRCNPAFRADMYEIIHFHIAEKDFEVPKKVKEIAISNPDVEHHNAYATFVIDGEKKDCFTVLIARKPFRKKGDRFFDCMETAIVPTDGSDTYYLPIDTDNFWKIFGKNTDYCIDPEECLADNFGYAMYYGLNGKAYKNPEIIEKILEYLRK